MISAEAWPTLTVRSSMPPAGELVAPRPAFGRMVGARGFEPPTSRSRTVRATRLRYAPNGPAHYTGIRGSRLPGVLSHELHELALPALPRARLAARALHDGEHLVLGAADGQDQAPALDELLHQRRRHRRPARGDQDAIEGRLVRPAERP